MIFKRIRDLREDNDLTQADIAKILNCSRRTYGDYEAGKIQWNAENLIILADYYDVSIDYLLNRDDIRKR